MRTDWRPIVWCCLLVAAALAPSRCSAGQEPSLAQPTDAVHLKARSIIRWQEDDATLLYLRRDAWVHQGPHGIAGSRLLIWFTETEKDGRRTANLQVYADAGASLLKRGVARSVKRPSLFRLSTHAGVVLNAEQVLAGDAPKEDGFLLRARAFRRDETLPEDVAQALPQEIRPSAEEMTVSDLTDEGAVLTLRGNARIVSGDLTLSADAIRVHLRFEGGRFESPRIVSVYAEGVADLRREREHITAETIYLDVQAGTGLALNARVRAYDPERDVPVQFGADRVRQVSRHRFVVEGKGFLTTSNFAKPHYRIEGKSIELVRKPEAEPPEDEPEERPERKESVVVSSRNNIFYVEWLPVFWWPYVKKDVGKGAYLIRGLELGRSGNLGNFIKARWNLYDLGVYSNEWSELTLRTDAFSDHGFGAGLDFEYDGATRFGLAHGYYIHDTAEEDDRDLPTPRDDRGELTLRHREFLPRGWRADLEIGWLSDRQFLRTYDRDEFDEGKDRETQLFLRKTSGNAMFTAQAKERVNDFQNYVERYSLAYHVIGQPTPLLPLVWTSHSDVSRLALRFDEVLAVPDPDHVVRLDTAHELSAPLRLGPFRSDPFVWGDFTAFSSEAGDDDSAARWATAYGVRAAGNFYRTYDAGSRRFQIDRLRHIITPTAEYMNRWEVSKGPAHFVQHDDIDALDELHRVTFGLRNRLQTYRFVAGERRPLDFATLDVDYATHLSDAGMDRGLDDYIEASGRWRVSERMQILSEDNRFNSDEHRLEQLNGEIALNFWQPLQVSLIHKYFLDLGTVGEPSHSISLLGIIYQPLFSRWRVELNTSYDFKARRRTGDSRDPRRLGSGVYLTRNLEGWEVTLGARFDQGLANETVLTFNVSPPGSGRGLLRLRTGGY